MKRISLILILSLYATALAAQVEYNPMQDYPTHEGLFQEVFGIPEDADSVSEVFTEGRPHPLLGNILRIIWMIAVFVYIAIFLNELLKATINAPSSSNLLGDGVSTPFAPIRMALAFFLLLTIPDGRHYSVVESIILSLNKFTNNAANTLYIENANLLVEEEDSLLFRDSSVSVSPYAALNVLKSSICEYYINDTYTSSIIRDETPVESDYEYTFQRRLDYKRLSMLPFFGSKLEGGCGGVQLKRNKPGKISYDWEDDPVSADTGPFVAVDSSQIVSIKSAVLYLKLWNSFKSEVVDKMDALATDIVEDDELEDQEIVNRFQDILTNFNVIASNEVKNALKDGALNNALHQMKEERLERVIRNGWFYGGAMPFNIASVHSKFSPFKTVSFKSFPPSSDLIDERLGDNVKDLMIRMDVLILGGQSGLTGGAVWTDSEKRKDLSWSNCLPNLLDCAGYEFTKYSLFVADGLKDPGRNPLVFTHAVGVNGTNAMVDTITAINGAYVATSAVAGISFLEFAGIGRGLRAGADIAYNSSSFMAKFALVTFGILGYYVPLMITIYYLVALFGYVVMLFVSLLGANFFAVGHAWLEGRGLVSAYAQRGYPSLLFSALHPVLIVGSLFIYLLLIPFAFRMLGYIYSMAITGLYETGKPTLMGGVITFLLLCAMIIVLHRVIAKLAIDLPDKVMRLIGVHESLSSTDFYQNIESRTESATSQVSSGIVDGSRAVAVGVTGSDNSQRIENHEQGNESIQDTASDSGRDDDRPRYDGGAPNSPQEGQAPTGPTEEGQGAASFDDPQGNGQQEELGSQDSRSNPTVTHLPHGRNGQRSTGLAGVFANLNTGLANRFSGGDQTAQDTASDQGDPDYGRSNPERSGSEPRPDDAPQGGSQGGRADDSFDASERLGEDTPSSESQQVDSDRVDDTARIDLGDEAEDPVGGGSAEDSFDARENINTNDAAKDNTPDD